MIDPSGLVFRGGWRALLVRAGLGVLIGVSLIVLPAPVPVHAAGGCVFVTRTGQVILSGDYKFHLAADGEGVVKWRDTGGFWSPCVGAGKLATLATTTSIDVTLSDVPTASPFEVLGVHLGATDGPLTAGGPPSGLERETIVVHGNDITVGVHASASHSTRIVAGPASVDLDDDGTINVVADNTSVAGGGINFLALSGGAAADVLDVTNSDAQHHLLYGHGGNDWLFGSDVDDELYGGDGHDFIDGLAGPDRLEGGEGIDSLLGGDGDDTLEGHLGADQLWAGTGYDVCLTDGGDTVVAECEDIQ